MDSDSAGAVTNVFVSLAITTPGGTMDPSSDWKSSRRQERSMTSGSNVYLLKVCFLLICK